MLKNEFKLFVDAIINVMKLIKNIFISKNISNSSIIVLGLLKSIIFILFLGGLTASYSTENNELRLYLVFIFITFIAIIGYWFYEYLRVMFLISKYSTIMKVEKVIKESYKAGKQLIKSVVQVRIKTTIMITFLYILIAGPAITGLTKSTVFGFLFAIPFGFIGILYVKRMYFLDDMSIILDQSVNTAKYIDQLYIKIAVLLPDVLFFIVFYVLIIIADINLLVTIAICLMIKFFVFDSFADIISIFLLLNERENSLKILEMRSLDGQ